MIRQDELVEKVKSYDPTANEDALRRAYVFSMKVHGSQMRASGDPYFSHPLEVARILSDMKLDDATIITALLHDTVEDTTATLDEIRKLFGSEIASLVNGVTKLTKLELQSDSTKQAENFRKLVLAMSTDLRVLLIKLADRVHNMRTLSHFGSEDKRKRIARETLEIYAPLAERIGIHHFKDELNDLAFKEINNDARESILARLHFLEQEGGRNIIDNILTDLEDLLKENGVKAQISGRVKTPYSIWHKMFRKNITFEQLSDIMAFRIVVDDLSQCYQALGIIHNAYPVISGRFKDFISTPKPNNYQSLHTSVISARKQRIEVQIRTTEMHRIAEYGVAAHWQYKAGEKRGSKMDYPWLKSLLEILEHASGPQEFLEHTKLEMFQDQVFCFTPTGDLIPLPRGAIPIDFAYAIHSVVGNQCIGAKINGRTVSLRTPLNNGDQVEIITSKSHAPSPSWEKIVVTGKARANIRRFIRIHHRAQYIELGHNRLIKSFSDEKLTFHEKDLDLNLNKLKLQSVEDAYALVGEGQITPYEVIRVLNPEVQIKQTTITPENLRLKKHRESDSALSIKGLIPGMAVHYAGCCHPLPGDQITGIVMSGTGVTVHVLQCENLKNYANEPERWIDVTWDHPEAHQMYVGRINI
ncbi:MAG: RelA/SpoT family protein [Janthinobacterium lividum]